MKEEIKKTIFNDKFNNCVIAEMDCDFDISDSRAPLSIEIKGEQYIWFGEKILKPFQNELVYKLYKKTDLS